jgi:hypothetical protein
VFNVAIYIPTTRLQDVYGTKRVINVSNYNSIAPLNAVSTGSGSQ